MRRASRSNSSSSAYANSRYRIARRSNFQNGGVPRPPRQAVEDVYVGKAGSCECICTRISPGGANCGGSVDDDDNDDGEEEDEDEVGGAASGQQRGQGS